MELRNRNFSTAFCSLFSYVTHFSHLFHSFKTLHFSHFSQVHFQNALFHIFRTFHMFHILVKTCGKKTRFENALGKKCEKMRFENALGKSVKNICLKKLAKCEETFEYPVGKVEFWHLFFRFDLVGSSFAALCCPTFAGWNWGAVQIGSGLCRSQICLIYL